MKRQVIRLTESDLKNIIKESVNRILNENSYGYENFDDDNYDDSDFDDDEFNMKMLYNWHIHILGDNYESEQTFEKESDAIADCDKKLEELNFYEMAKIYNKNYDDEEDIIFKIYNKDYDDEAVIASIDSWLAEPSMEDEYDNEPDTVLVNCGFGWYD